MANNVLILKEYLPLYKNGFNIILKILLFFFFSGYYSFIENAYAQCSKSIVPPDTINGVFITESYSGSVGRYSSAFSSCTGSNTVTTPINSIYLGQSGSFSYTMNFSKSINDLIIAITATGQGANENFIFNTSAGNPTITAISSCYSTINGAEIISGAGAPGGIGEEAGAFLKYQPHPIIKALPLQVRGDKMDPFLQFAVIPFHQLNPLHLIKYNLLQFAKMIFLK